jgi:hypothetical protein
MTSMLLVILLFSFLLSHTCIRQVEKYEEESGKTILQSVGEELGKAKREFEKGYKDTIK